MTTLTYKLEQFEGPIDLLLVLISKNKVNILDIPISLILKQFMEQIEAMKQHDLEITADFLTVAAHLIYIKSKMLLPDEKEEEEADPREILVKMLLEYKRYKTLAEEFENMSDGYSNIFTKDTDIIEKDNKYKKTHNINELELAFRNSFKKIKRRLPPPVSSFNGIVNKTVISVLSRAVRIMKGLRKYGSINLSSLFDSTKNKSEKVATFLAVLELIRNKRLKIDRDDNIKIVK